MEENEIILGQVKLNGKNSPCIKILASDGNVEDEIVVLKCIRSSNNS